MFFSRNQKNDVYPCKPQFYYMYIHVVGQNYIWFRNERSSLYFIIVGNADGMRIKRIAPAVIRK